MKLLPKVGRAYRALIQSSPGMKRVARASLDALAWLVLRLKRMKAPPEFSFSGKMIVAWGLRDRNTTAVFKKMVTPGMCVIDVGANVGDYCRLLSRLVGSKGRVYAFEPCPDTFRYLAYNTAHSKNVRCLDVAIADREGSTEFFLHPESCASHSLVDLARSGHTITVPVTTLDNFLHREGIGSVDLVKIDVEGAEFQVWHGMKTLVNASRRLALITEVSPAHFERSGTRPEVFLQELRRAGFVLYFIGSGGSLQRMTEDSEIITACRDEEAGGNVLCLKGYPEPL